MSSHELLPSEGADRDDQSSPVGNLVDQRRRNGGRGGRDEDGVERRERRRAGLLAGRQHVDMIQAEALERRRGPPAQHIDDLNGDDIAREPGDDGRLVTRSGADLKHAVGGFQRERLGHHPDDQRLRDGLPVADRECPIGVGVAADLLGDELVPWHRSHRRQHARVAHDLGDARNHARAPLGERRLLVAVRRDRPVVGSPPVHAPIVRRRRAPGCVPTASA